VYEPSVTKGHTEMRWTILLLSRNTSMNVYSKQRFSTNGNWQLFPISHLLMFHWLLRYKNVLNRVSTLHAAYWALGSILRRTIQSWMRRLQTFSVICNGDNIIILITSVSKILWRLHFLQLWLKGNMNILVLVLRTIYSSISEDDLTLANIPYKLHF
jgi:hypothetical protein